MKAKLLRPLPSYTMEHEDYYYQKGDIVEVHNETADGESSEEYTGYFWIDASDDLAICGVSEDDLELIN